MKSYQITAWSHELFKLQVTPGGVYIDATMGNGYDTQFLCEMAGETGKVWAFDIQEQALKATKERLAFGKGRIDFGQPYPDGTVCEAGFCGRHLF